VSIIYLYTVSKCTETYSRYFKNLQNDKEIILFLSTYQNIHPVRDTLADVDLDVGKFERDGSLDSVRSYFGVEDKLGILSIAVI